jgi:hypothetical protein
MHAIAATPAEPLGVLFARFPQRRQPSLHVARSASALIFSRPAQRSFALRHAWSPGFFQDPLHRRIQPPRSLCDCIESCRVGFAPTGRPPLHSAPSDDVYRSLRLPLRLGITHVCRARFDQGRTLHAASLIVSGPIRRADEICDQYYIHIKFFASSVLPLPVHRATLG